MRGGRGGGEGTQMPTVESILHWNIDYLFTCDSLLISRFCVEMQMIVCIFMCPPTNYKIKTPLLFTVYHAISVSTLSLFSFLFCFFFIFYFAFTSIWENIWSIVPFFFPFISSSILMFLRLWFSISICFIISTSSFVDTSQAQVNKTSGCWRVYGTEQSRVKPN